MLRKGITPDSHVTLESDYMDVDYLDHLNDPDYLKQIQLLGPLHINPVVLSRFKAFRSIRRRKVDWSICLPRKG